VTNSGKIGWLTLWRKFVTNFSRKRQSRMVSSKGFLAVLKEERVRQQFWELQRGKECAA
jgi:hypothetical protein